MIGDANDDVVESRICVGALHFCLAATTSRGVGRVVAGRANAQPQRRTMTVYDLLPGVRGALLALARSVGVKSWGIYNRRMADFNLDSRAKMPGRDAARNEGLSAMIVNMVKGHDGSGLYVRGAIDAYGSVADDGRRGGGGGGRTRRACLCHRCWGVVVDSAERV